METFRYHLDGLRFAPPILRISVPLGLTITKVAHHVRPPVALFAIRSIPLIGSGSYFGEIILAIGLHSGKEN